MQVDSESLQIRIDNLEMLKRHDIISLSGEYQLEAYKMLLDYMDKYAELQERYDLDVNPEGK